MTAFAGVNWARALSRGQNPLGWKAIAVAHVLADHVDGDGHCVLKQETIAREARISEHAVRDGLKELRALGAVSDKRTRGASRFHLNTDTTRRPLASVRQWSRGWRPRPRACGVGAGGRGQP
jgi:hypothetical protein